MDNVAVKISEQDLKDLKRTNYAFMIAEKIANREGYFGIHNPNLIDCGSFYRLAFEYERIER